MSFNAIGAPFGSVGPPQLGGLGGGCYGSVSGSKLGIFCGAIFFCMKIFLINEKRNIVTRILSLPVRVVL